MSLTGNKMKRAEKAVAAFSHAFLAGPPTTARASRAVTRIRSLIKKAGDDWEDVALLPDADLEALAGALFELYDAISAEYARAGGYGPQGLRRVK